MNQWDFQHQHQHQHLHQHQLHQLDPTYFGGQGATSSVDANAHPHHANAASFNAASLPTQPYQADQRPGAMTATFHLNRAVSGTPSAPMPDDAHMLGRQPKRRRTGENLSQEATWQYGGMHEASSFIAPAYGNVEPRQSNSPMPHDDYMTNPALRYANAAPYGQQQQQQQQHQQQQQQQQQQQPTQAYMPPSQSPAFASHWSNSPSAGQQQYAAPTSYATNQPGGSSMPTYPNHPGDVHSGMGFEVPGFQNYQGMGTLTSSFDGLGSAQRQASGQARPASGVSFEDASMHLKLQSLPMLDNLATQLIQTLAKSSWTQLQELMSGSENESVQAYSTVKNLFDQTRKVYTRGTPFIDAKAIQLFQPQQQETIRKANIATFVASILGAHDVSFFHLNRFFLETFVPQGLRLLKWQGVIFLELKTQAYIYSLINSDVTPQASLDELFPAELEQHLLSRHPDAPSFSPSEQDFTDRVKARKSYLAPSSSIAPDMTLYELPKKYNWNDFVREFAFCINKNLDSLLNNPMRANQPIFNTSASRIATNNQVQHTARESSLSFHHANPPSRSTTSTPTAMDRARSTLSSMPISSNPSTPGALPQPSNSIPHSKPPTPTRHATATTTNPPTSNSKNHTPTPPSHTPTTTATTANSTPTSTPTIRQPWTKPEEDALLSGLGQVNGPHWSQILALYGRGGSQSEVLKDRNQVQLKDKARNLKLWYLKTGREVPVCLRGVTGELRKRGGARVRAALGLDGDGNGGSGGRNAGDVEVARGKGEG